MDKIEGRKIIFECVTGSKLYGTNNENSDDDFTGIFLPSSEDILGLQAPPKEWAMNEKNTTTARNGVGDVDRKYYSLAQWFKMVASGQSWAVEMLFAPKDKITIQTEEWQEVNDNGVLLLSKKSVAGVVGFALAQSHKASIRGENLNLIRDVVACLETYSDNGYKCKVDGKKLKISDVMATTSICTCLHNANFKPWGEQTAPNPRVDIVKGKDGTDMMEIAGRKFNVGRDIKWTVRQLKQMESRYGTRSQATAESGLDWKSLYHAYRLVAQAKEMLSDGKITLPRPPEEVEFLMKIRNEEYDADHRAELQGFIKEIDEVYKPKSVLPEGPDWSKIDRLCGDIMRRHLFPGNPIDV